MSLRIGCICLLVMMLTACAATPSSTPIPHTGYRPRFEERECWGKILPGVEATCGFVIVPENRSKPFGEDNLVRLAVVVMRSAGLQAEQSPTFLLGGGPGQDVVGMFAGMAEEYQSMLDKGFPGAQYTGHLQDMQQFKAVMDLLIADLQKREFVLFDQRGAGYSEPSLKCHGEGWDVCRERLVSAGVDIAAYNTIENVEDVNDIRLALGYEQINLQGGSYGTRLALETMRRYPQIVRAAVLDGVAPPQIDWGVEMVARYEKALVVLFDHCHADQHCNTAYPNLETVFYNLIERLNDHPIEVTVGEDVERLNGNDLRDTVWNALYDAIAIRFLPMLITRLNQGNPDVWGNLLAATNRNQAGETIAWGMHYSVDCAERWAFQERADLVAAAQALRPAIREEVIDYFAQTFATCQDWNVPVAPAYVHTPVQNDVPTLLVSGEFDPGTPPAFAEVAAQTLTQHYNLVFPYRGHTDGFTSVCYSSVISAFFDDPSHAPGTTCIAEMDKPTFIMEKVP